LFIRILLKVEEVKVSAPRGQLCVAYKVWVEVRAIYHQDPLFLGNLILVKEALGKVFVGSSFKLSLE
jgi:hypothetical protein